MDTTTEAPPLRTTADDGSRTYTYPPTGEQLWSVTTILSATEGKPFLVPWAARLAAEYAVSNLDLLAKTIGAADTPEQGWQAAVDLCKSQARQVRELKADVGSYVHSVVEALCLWAASPDGTGDQVALPLLPDHLAGHFYDDDDRVEDVADWMIEGFMAFIVQWRPEVLAAEMTVFHQPLGIAGTLDLILRFRDTAIAPNGRLMHCPGQTVTLCTDVKTGKHKSVTWQEQIAAYRRMKECLLPLGDLHPLPATDGGAVLHLRPEHVDGYRLHLVTAEDDEVAWERFTSAHATFTGRQRAKAKPGKVSRPPRPDGTLPAPLLADLDEEGYGRILTPLIRAGVRDLDQLAAMTEGQVRQVKGIGPKSVTTIRVLLADHGLCLRGEAA